jgi:hypothetical protein
VVDQGLFEMICSRCCKNGWLAFLPLLKMAGVPTAVKKWLTGTGTLVRAAFVPAMYRQHSRLDSRAKSLLLLYGCQSTLD